MSEFKVGDRVRIREDLQNNKEYNGVHVALEMLDYKGKIATIESIRYYGYEINLDNHTFTWTREMFEIIKTPEQQKIEQLEQRIEKSEKCVMGEQNSLEKCENKPIYEKNERFAKILKKELERNAVILNNPKPSLLTEDERVILRNIDREIYKWIARNENGNLNVYSIKPKKIVGLINDYWCCYDDFSNFDCFDHLFQFIKWTDNEPYNIEELLKVECEE